MNHRRLAATALAALALVGLFACAPPERVPAADESTARLSPEPKRANAQSPISSVAKRIALDPIELQMIPVEIDGETFRLATYFFRPDGKPPFPTVIFHHGSTGRGKNPKTFIRKSPYLSLSEYFLARGWAVALLSRRGRGGSDGLYDEGFKNNRAEGYSCTPSITLRGFERALADVEAVTAKIRALPFVDPSRLLVGGQSRGGILAAVHAANRPSWYQGVVSFVAGWLGEYRQCPDAADVNQGLFARAAPYPHEILWLHAPKDRAYSDAHVAANFGAFKDAGGQGTFYRDLPTNIGHSLKVAIELFEPPVDAYLARRGLPHTVRDRANPIPVSRVRSTPPSGFLGIWNGRMEQGVPLTIKITDAYRYKLRGTYRAWYRTKDGKFKPRKRFSKFLSPVRDGMFYLTSREGRSPAYYEFFLVNDNTMRAKMRWAGARVRALLIRTSPAD